MQITIAIAVPYHHFQYGATFTKYREWKREETKNTDEIVQKFIDGTKQIKRNQEACMISRLYLFYQAWLGMHPKDALN
ncbi:hypothetical protein T4D_15812 [Trichinella pseudospiralis]|uniref:Uncharacterized protein n=1 Tax=Trichinella pseudospiralis TaxID=6337 RepID=A0A0V1FDV9_TRIPS|nr:hypothetical protein T4D_15812 [Trichinella pseudospiralis]